MDPLETTKAISDTFLSSGQMGALVVLEALVIAFLYLWHRKSEVTSLLAELKAERESHQRTREQWLQDVRMLGINQNSLRSTQNALEVLLKEKQAEAAL